MDFLSIEPVTIPCSELIPGVYNLKQEGSQNISFNKLLVISYTLTDFTLFKPCFKELNDKDFIYIFEKCIKPMVGLPYEIITFQGLLLLSEKFPD